MARLNQYRAYLNQISKTKNQFCGDIQKYQLFVIDRLSLMLYYSGIYNNQFLMSNNQQKQDNEQIMINVPEGFHAPLFCWDVNKTSHKIKLDPECLRAKSTEGNGFKTTMGTQIFTQGGRYYFEIFINKGQLIKIGICRPSITNLEEAFSDGVNGWAIYNGQTRHNSNSTGPNYGTQLASGDIIGVALDMVQGTLAYYRNEAYWGIAFKDEQLKKGQMVAAVSPIYNNDTFTLRNMIKQD